MFRPLSESLLEIEESGYRPFLPIRIEAGKYVIKTAENNDELKAALRLRYEIFNKEYGRQPNDTGYDLDYYDFLGDHLIIVDSSIGKVVGTYRLISTRFSERFYSESEFYIRRFLASPGEKLELGRACIHPDYRTGIVIHVLWKGIIKYVLETKARYLFGRSSIKTIKNEDAALITKYFQTTGLFSDEFNVTPKAGFKMDGLQAAFTSLGATLEESQMQAAQEWIPSLMEAYFKAGAKVFGEPAVDLDFNCIDFFTVLDTELLTKSFDRKYRQSPTS